MTVVIISVPTALAAFFGGLAGAFIPFSVFGGAGRRSQSDASGQAGHPPIAGQGQPPSQDPAQTHAFRLSGQHTAPQADEIKPPGTHQGLADSDFLERYPNAVASNERVGGGDPLPAELVPVAAGVPALTEDIYGASTEKLRQVLDFQAAVAHRHVTGQLSDQDYAAARQAASRAFYSEFDQSAQAYADSLINNRGLTMQEKYDGLSGLGAKAIAVGERNGIDYFPGAAAQATAIGDAAIQQHGLFDPRRPTRVFVDNPGDAGEPLRALLNLRPEDDLRSRTLNPDPGALYASGRGDLAQSEPWRDSFELVGQIVQQQDAINLVTGVTAQRTASGADALSGMGREPNPDPYNQYIEAHSKWVARSGVGLSRVEGGLSAAGFASDVYVNSKEPYLTIDVFSSKVDPSERWFKARTFDLRLNINSFEKRDMYTNDETFRKIVDGR